MKSRSLPIPSFLCFSIVILLTLMTNNAAALDWPFRGDTNWITSVFGEQRTQTDNHIHAGVDLDAPADNTTV